MSYIEYTEEQKAEFCALAQEIGIGRAIRELGYPKGYSNGVRWMTQRGIKPNVDKMMQNVKIWHTFYEVDDLLEQIDTAMAVAQDVLLKADTADDVKKVAEALQKLVNTRLLLEGKSTSITEKRETTQMDLEIADLIAAEKAKNNLMKEDSGTNQESTALAKSL